MKKEKIILPLTCDLLLVGLPQLHLPHLTRVLNAREHLQRYRLILIEERRHWRVLRIPPRHRRFPLRRHVRFVFKKKNLLSQYKLILILMVTNRLFDSQVVVTGTCSGIKNGLRLFGGE